MINGCQGLVRSIAWKIHQKAISFVELDDLIAYGQVGLAEAARDFDHDREVAFSTYAYYRIRGAILSGLETMSWFNRSEYSRGRYERCANELLVEKDDCDNTAYDEVRWFKQTASSLAVVYLMSQNATDDQPELAIEDSNAPQPDSLAELDDMSQKLRRLIADLPSDARTLLEGVYFQGLTIKEAGEQCGISKAWASRLHARTLQQLASRLTLAIPSES